MSLGSQEEVSLAEGTAKAMALRWGRACVREDNVRAL